MKRIAFTLAGLVITVLLILHVCALLVRFVILRVSQLIMLVASLNYLVMLELFVVAIVFVIRVSAVLVLLTALQVSVMIIVFVI